LFAPPEATEKSGADGDQDDDKIDLPVSRQPVQVLARLDSEGKLVVKTAIKTIRRVGAADGSPNLPSADSAAPEAGAAKEVDGDVVRSKAVTTLRSQTYDLDDVQVLDTMGAKVNRQELAKLLKEQRVAMAVFAGEPVDPLHLRVLKDGTLILVLPGSKASGDTTNPDLAPPGAFHQRPVPGPPADVLLPGVLPPQPMPGGPSPNPDRVPDVIPPAP
jgi:hypothetical protein